MRDWVVIVQEIDVTRPIAEDLLWDDAKVFHFKGLDEDGEMRAAVGAWLTENLRRRNGNIPDTGPREGIQDGDQR